MVAKLITMAANEDSASVCSITVTPTEQENNPIVPNTQVDPVTEKLTKGVKTMLPPPTLGWF